jgi:hypothetical protein
MTKHTFLFDMFEPCYSNEALWNECQKGFANLTLKTRSQLVFTLLTSF